MQRTTWRPLSEGEISAPAGGRFHGGCAPHSLFVLDKKRMRRARWKRKNRFIALRRLRASALYGGRREMVPACLRWPSDGRGVVRYRLDGGFPRRGCRGQRGARTHLTCISFRAFRFATRSPGSRRGRCPHRPVAEAFINHRLAAAKIGAGCIPVLPRTGGFPKGSAFPSLTAARDRQPSPAGGRRSALARTDPPNIFSFPPGAAHFLFDVSKRKWGAHLPSHQHG